MVKVNGEPLDLAGMRLSDYLSSASYSLSFIAVEKNGTIVPRSQYDSCILADGDSVEIVSFVGGG